MGSPRAIIAVLVFGHAIALDQRQSYLLAHFLGGIPLLSEMAGDVAVSPTLVIVRKGEDIASAATETSGILPMGLNEVGQMAVVANKPHSHSQAMDPHHPNRSAPFPESPRSSHG